MQCRWKVLKFGRYNNYILFIPVSILSPILAFFWGWGGTNPTGPVVRARGETDQCTLPHSRRQNNILNSLLLLHNVIAKAKSSLDFTLCSASNDWLSLSCHYNPIDRVVVASTWLPKVKLAEARLVL